MPSSNRRNGYHFNAGFLTNRRVRRILQLAGYDLKLGKPTSVDDVLVWGHSPYAPRGEAAARASGASLVRVEDAFLRSLHPGRDGDPPLGLVIDRQGIYFDATTPSDLETILMEHPLDEDVLLARVGDAIARIRAAHLGKYSATDPELAPLEPGYVLVIDQTRGDASIRLGMASDDSFAAMLAAARADHPDASIVIKTHPETLAGHRKGHFDPNALPEDVVIEDRPISPWRLFEGARAVYCVTSQLGFEACLAGHKPICFGVPFYAGWGLTEDRGTVPVRRNRSLTIKQLAAGALLLYPTWYDPYRDALGDVKTVLGALEAQSRAWREDRAGYTALGMRSWKRGHLKDFFARKGGDLKFAETVADVRDGSHRVMVWAGHETDRLRRACAAKNHPLVRVEDGFLRSRGLGAELIAPLSLVCDPLGIYYDPTRESLLERLITEAAELPLERLARSQHLIETIKAGGVTKYNLQSRAVLPVFPSDREIVLVPGQVEDDASIRLGAGAIHTNNGLVEAARRDHPGAFLIYKPHPDVVAGLRDGGMTQTDLVDHVATSANTSDLLVHATRVVTMTSALGFEALLRGVAVTTVGAPFYAGWGLTTDLGHTPDRRTARPSLAALVHAALITYPRYFDPVTRLPCP
ncbi:MAG: capsular polysaccharide biosynthesis protein, partial [Octadecabacter sp.]|nr:capsular polysaccharide biosynthesis protein [Octadecabacter sp.]